LGLKEADTIKLSSVLIYSGTGIQNLSTAKWLDPIVNQKELELIKKANA
jgi:carboxypeptidase C (cathepsin A)